MPFTLAHPAVVVPLWRLAPRNFVLSALVVGSMAPDFEYFVYLRPVRTIGHDFHGVWLLCVPSGLLLLAIYEYVLKGPLIALFPASIRLRLAPYEAPEPLLPLPRLLRILVSLAVGAFSHIAWDACTHENGWVVQRVFPLSWTILDDDGPPLKVYKVLQYGGTVVGLGLLAAWSRRWIKRQPLIRTPERTGMPDLARIGVLALLLSFPWFFGVTQALNASSGGLYRMAGHFVVSTITAGFLLILAYCAWHRVFAGMKASCLFSFPVSASRDGEASLSSPVDEALGP